MRLEDAIQAAPMTRIKIQWHRSNVDAMFHYAAVLDELGLHDAAYLEALRAAKYQVEIGFWEQELSVTQLIKGL